MDTRTGGHDVAAGEAGLRAPLEADVRARLEVIGKLLDRGVFPEVMDQGAVVPSRAKVHSKPLGTSEKVHAQRKGPPGPSGSRQRGPSPQGAPRTSRASSRASSRARTSGATPSFVVDDLRQQYEQEVARLSGAYPGTQVWAQRDGLWFKSPSSLLPGLGFGAEFLVCLQFTPFPAFRAWGFWSDRGWIGPRHTNFPDGSICAFDLRDGTWGLGDSIVNLLDLYSLWAVRHLHLAVFGRWPGAQSVPFLYERLWEFKDDELCGCGETEDKSYAECCKPGDLRTSAVRAAVNFTLPRFGGLRAPPHIVTDFVQRLADPPATAAIFDRVTLAQYDHEQLPLRYRAAS